MRAYVDGDEEGVVEVDGVRVGGLSEEGHPLDWHLLFGQVGGQQAHFAPGAPRRLWRMKTCLPRLRDLLVKGKLEIDFLT